MYLLNLLCALHLKVNIILPTRNSFVETAIYVFYKILLWSILEYYLVYIKALWRLEINQIYRHVDDLAASTSKMEQIKISLVSFISSHLVFLSSPTFMPQ